jgi:phosphoglycolate phosphatase-like HAD superfamily hydrolase
VDAGEVINIGDTPSDLLSGKNAGCLLSLGVTNGTHTVEQLSEIENDGLLSNILELRQIIEDLVI